MDEKHREIGRGEDPRLSGVGHAERDHVYDQQLLERHFWRLWFLLVMMSLLTMGGLATTIPTFKHVLASAWPWKGTDVVLLAGLVVVMVVFAGYLTYQQKRIAKARARLRWVRTQSKQRARQHYSRLMALYSVSQVMGSENDPQKVFDCIVSMCQEIFASEQASLMLLHKREAMLEVQSAIGHPNQDEIRGTRRRVGEGIGGWVAQNRKPVLLGPDSDLSLYPGLQFRRQPLFSAMVVPLVVQDEVAGVLSVASRSQATRYTQEDLAALLVFAESAEACIRHTQQTDWMRQTIRSLRDQSLGAARRKPSRVRDEVSKRLEL